MTVRVLSFCLALAFAAAPMVARADLWVNLKGLKVTDYGGSKCDKVFVNGLKCISNGQLALDTTDRAKPASCAFKFWPTVGGHWHFDFTRNSGCKANWINGNTLEIAGEHYKSQVCGKRC